MERLAIVIPAHDEERTIRRSLDALAGLEAEAEVAVVCNGCTDATAAVAREAAPWAEVIELAVGSKPAALNAGDRALSAMPRLYLDADVMITADGVRRLAGALARDDLVAVAPTPRYDTRGAGRLIRSHYRIWTALMERHDVIYGTGAMMVSAAGRRRFGDWPDVIADDYFLDGLFAAPEKRRLPDVDVVVALPRRFGDCVSRRARVHQGNLDVRRAGLRPFDIGSPRGGAGLIGLIRARPPMIVDVPGHLVVTVAARSLRLWRRWRGAQRRFYRDVTTR